MAVLGRMNSRIFPQTLRPLEAADILRHIKIGEDLLAKLDRDLPD